MHPLANHLIQLQELTLIKDEQKITIGTEGHLEQLNENIRGMTEKLPHDIKVKFDKLHKKDHIVIAPVSAGICTVCAMRLPISLVQAVRIGREILDCPNCARMLYFPEAAPQWIKEAPRRGEPRKAGVSRFSSHTLMVPRLESEDTDGVIRELAYKMESEGFVDKAEKLVESALRREAILSTAFDHGLAFPHVRGVEGGGLALALGLSPKGIKFGGVERPLTKIVFFMVIPTTASAFYLKLLAGLTETFMKPDNRKAVLAEKEPDKLWKALVRVTKITIK